MSVKLLVKGLPLLEIAEIDLVAFFRGCKIISFEIATSDRSGKCRGFGYIEVESEREAKKVLSYSGKEYKKKTLSIEVMPPPPVKIRVRCKTCGRVFDEYSAETLLPRHKPAGSKTPCDGSGEKGIEVRATE